MNVEASEFNISNGIYHNGTKFMDNSLPLKDPNGFFRMSMTAANDGQSGAQLNLALCFLNGIGTTTNLDEAIRWMMESINQKNPDACILAYQLLQEGVILPDTIPFKLHDLLEIAAENGNCYAMNKIAEELETSNHESDQIKAFDYYTRAANCGFVPSFYNIGYCYELGLCTQQDKKQAYLWYKKAIKYNDLPKIRSGITRVEMDLKKMGIKLEDLDVS